MTFSSVWRWDDVSQTLKYCAIDGAIEIQTLLIKMLHLSASPWREVGVLCSRSSCCFRGHVWARAQVPFKGARSVWWWGRPVINTVEARLLHVYAQTKRAFLAQQPLPLTRSSSLQWQILLDWSVWRLMRRSDLRSSIIFCFSVVHII